MQQFQLQVFFFPTLNAIKIVMDWSADTSLYTALCVHDSLLVCNCTDVLQNIVLFLF